MIFNLYEYANASVIFILAFQSVLNDDSYDYVICYSFKGTNMAKFLDALVEGKMKNTFYSIYDLTEASSESNTSEDAQIPHKRIKVEISNAKTRFKNHEGATASISRNKACKIIEMPFTKSLYTKAVIQEKNANLCEFTYLEIYCIFKYIFLNLDDKIWISQSICLSLQNDPEIFFSLSEYQRKIRVVKGNDHFLHKFIGNFDCDAALKRFRQIVNSSLYVRLTVEDESIAYLSGTKIVTNNLNTFSVPFKESKICFLFKYIIVEFQFFVLNADTFYDILNCNGHRSKLNILVSEIFKLNEAVGMYTKVFSLKSKLSCVSRHKLSSLHHVERITFEFSRFFSKKHRRRFNYNEYLGKIYFIYYAIDMINSVPQPAKTVKVYLSKPSIESINLVPEDVTYLKCIGPDIRSNFTFSEQFKGIIVVSLALRPGLVLTFAYGLEELDLSNVQGTIDLSNNVGFGKILLNHVLSQVSYSKKDEGGPNFFHLFYAKINTEVAVDPNMDNIIFEGITSSYKISVPLGNNVKKLNIGKSSASYDFDGNLKGCLHFNNAAVLQINTDDDSASDFKLMTCSITTPFIISGSYGNITLTDINVRSGACLTVRNDCKNLTLMDCGGVVELSTSARFERITVGFSENSSVVELVLKGAISTNYLAILNMPRNIASIFNIIGQFNYIKHLNIKNSSLEAPWPNLENHFRFRELPSPDSDFLEHDQKNNSLNKHENMERCVENAQKTTSSETLSAFFQKLVNAKVEVLEYCRVWISSYNCRFLNDMQHLKVLIGCVENLSGENMDYLPKSLRLLNVSGSYINNMTSEAEGSFKNALKALSNLEVLIVDDEFLVRPARLKSLPPRIEILVLKNCKLKKIRHKVQARKLKLRKLYISASVITSENGVILPCNPVFNDFMRSLYNYIDLKYLEELFYITLYTNYQLNPVTMQSIQEWNDTYSVDFLAL
ncbi:putative LRR containing protein [Trachipleistophora hominis]|uniref:Putative LRR containing protein n=1 Tax=Trachipleistophora hominis TaxID=72359 RepID=L7JS28_TRAHO|nr:putative LRR containing protein [Trachipleistophora hominis]